MLKGRHAINLLSALIIVVLGGLACFYLEPPIPVIIAFWIVGALSLLLGVLMVLPIGGADMPVVISLLNAFSGLAAAMTGFVLEKHLLIVVGSLVGASGTVLTRIMSKAMNRSLMNIILGGVGGTVIKVTSSTPKAALPKTEAQEKPKTGIPAAVEALKKAERVVVVPGYGMALAQAQFEVVKLTNFLEEQGKNVVFAVHPVAGRMPGHMNVLLAEAEVDYEKLLELEESNEEFPKTDVVMIIGACDVVNPAANDPSMDTPLSGMPILEASKAKSVIVCNLDARPGYSGVENPLYDDPKTLMLLGDALGTIKAIRSGLDKPQEAAAATQAPSEGGIPSAAEALRKAERIVVVPGYGMALAQAQFEVIRLTNFLESQGKNVLFAVHPVAGRMPGHMNVLLAEAEVDYEKLLELEESNAEFPRTDVVMIIGACDVVNPAANDPTMDTPLSGMPILEASQAKAVIVCNLDDRPGYSGVENPLYDDPKTTMLLGDALKTIKDIRKALGSSD